VTGVNPNKVWETYLESFPPGTNEIFRERREYDCSCCRQFIRAFGNVVAIKGGKVVSIWDFKVDDEKYQMVIDALSKAVKAHSVSDVFMPTFRSFGTKKNLEQVEGGHINTWYHLHAVVADSVKVFKVDEVGSQRGVMRDNRNVLQRSLTELTLESIDTVLDLIAQKSLYKGEEWAGPLKKFRAMHKEYKYLVLKKYKDNYCWTTSLEAGAALSKIKNHSIGVLLTDISEGMDLNEAVKRYEKIVAPSNYKRPKAIFTKRMIQDAKKKVAELGLENSLGRRFATLEDITVNNILFANRDTARKMAGDAFDELAESVPDKPRKFDKVEEVNIEMFVKDILPNAEDIEVLLENKHASNMVSLIAPKDRESASLFKWDNGFSWAYSGNITDSMRERVVQAGGRVDGPLRFTHTWNYDGQNQSLMDLHVFMPGYRGSCKEEEIHDQYPVGRRVGWNKRNDLHSGGVQDVDFVRPPGKAVPIENISFPDIRRMPEGRYVFKIHNWKLRQTTRSGFKAEIELNGNIYRFEYAQPLKDKQWITVGEANLKDGQFTFTPKMDSTQTSKEVWGLTTQKFHPVSVCAYSPNYWDGQSGIGHRHYLFLLKGCKNEESPNGFFNEFLREEFMPHKRVFEALGSKLAVEDSEDQLSGLGFSSTKRASLICRVKGSFLRVIKLVF
jgi:hypothetical protein